MAKKIESETAQIEAERRQWRRYDIDVVLHFLEVRVRAGLEQAYFKSSVVDLQVRARLLRARARLGE